uniref:Uncharacterized protein n=1 Tax=Octopus bimaculoides TaxID=37653 RepID=A0A0L8GAB4_OCTBM
MSPEKKTRGWKYPHGTGLAEILLEAGHTSSESFMGVISVKNYARSLNCHKVLMEALKRLVLASFLQNQDEEVPFGNLPNFGGDNHARYLTFFSMFIANIERSHPSAEDLLKRGPLKLSSASTTLSTSQMMESCTIYYPALRLQKKLRRASSLLRLLHWIDRWIFSKKRQMKGFKYAVKECDDVQLLDPRQSFIIEDGNAVFHCLRKIPQTFGEYAEDSVKGVERNRRGVGDKLTLSGEEIKRLKDWKVFLANDETQFIQLLLSTWRSEVSADILTGYEKLTSDGHNTFCQEICSLECSQEETDTHVILYCMYAKERGCTSVCMRSPDSDIFFILLHHARFLEGLQILFETGKGNTQCCINMTKLAMSSTLVLWVICWVIMPLPGRIVPVPPNGR